VVNPLTVSINSKSKERLILDLRHVNKQVLLSKFKFEDWRTLKQYATPDSFGFVFDLKSGYHHIDIHDYYQRYLGFSWKIDNIVKYIAFTGVRQSSNLNLLSNTCLFTCLRSRMSLSLLLLLIDTVNGLTTWGLLDTSLIKPPLSKYMYK
jgi:hypothetical protein